MVDVPEANGEPPVATVNQSKLQLAGAVAVIVAVPPGQIGPGDSEIVGAAGLG